MKARSRVRGNDSRKIGEPQLTDVSREVSKNNYSGDGWISPPSPKYGPNTEEEQQFDVSRWRGQQRVVRHVFQKTTNVSQKGSALPPIRKSSRFFSA